MPVAGLPPGSSLGGVRIQLGDLVLNQVDASGVAWYCGTLQGWDAPDVRGDWTEREADHGAWAPPVYLGARPITLAGTLSAPDRPSLEAAMDTLRAAVSLTDTTLTVWESVPKQATVRRSGQLLITYATDQVATYSAMVTAGDPRRYAVDLSTGSTGLPSTTGGLTPPLTPPITMSAVTVAGEIDVSNAGTFPTRPVLTVTGPVTQPRIAALYPDGTVAQLAYADTLGTGDQLVIDTDAHTVTLNGTASRRRYLSGDWPEIPAGGSAAVQFRASSYNSSALLTATWRSAWL